MPKKVRELRQMLRQAGFVEVDGKGSHTNWICTGYAGKLTVSGADGDDARRYQEKDVRRAIQEAQEKQDIEDSRDENDSPEV